MIKLLVAAIVLPLWTSAALACGGPRQPDCDFMYDPSSIGDSSGGGWILMIIIIAIMVMAGK